MHAVVCEGPVIIKSNLTRHLARWPIILNRYQFFHFLFYFYFSFFALICLYFDFVVFSGWLSIGAPGLCVGGTKSVSVGGRSAVVKLSVSQCQQNINITLRSGVEC